MSITLVSKCIFNFHHGQRSRQFDGQRSRSCRQTCVGQDSISSVRVVKEAAFGHPGVGVDAAVEVGRKAKTSPEARGRKLQSRCT
eukprot:scaffold30769_cov71-Phaeocystis_antarctica.AAC.2